MINLYNSQMKYQVMILMVALCIKIQRNHKQHYLEGKNYVIITLEYLLIITMV